MKKRNEFQKNFSMFSNGSAWIEQGKGNQSVLREQKPTPQWQQGRQKISETVGRKTISKIQGLIRQEQRGGSKEGTSFFSN